MPSWLCSSSGVLFATAASQRLMKTDATEPTLGLRPASIRRSMPRRNASAAARYCSRENKRVTLTGIPEKIASSIAGRPSFVPGILIKQIGTCRSRKQIPALRQEYWPCHARGVGHFQRYPSVNAIRLVVNGSKEIGRPREILQRQFEE